MEICTGVVSSVVEKILEYPIRLIGRHLGYLIYYRANQKNLTNQVTELDNKKSSIERRAHEAQRNNEELEKCVTDWISKAERKIQEANGVITDGGHENAKCACNGSFPNLLSRYKLSKQAKLMAEDIVDHIEKPGKFENFSYRPLIQHSFKNKDFEAFVSRTKTSNEIMEALKDPDIPMIGVYGMGGVGKTTLVKEVAHQAKIEEFFSEVVMVTVSQEFNPKNIQQGIAEVLGLRFEGEILSNRANELRKRLSQEKKILIILDDIWSELELLEVGIYFEAGDQKGCKILLVSRDRDVLCNRMGVTKSIEVKILSGSEAQGLFNKFVGDKADNLDFKELANQVVGECGGLPIAIETIACSLKNKDIIVWKDFFYSSIKMSYDFLENEEEKKFLLLCSLYREDANVRVNDLMFYGIGLDLFQEVHAMEEARCRAHSLVDKLKAHCLLLDGDYKNTVKMHDVICDVMISIAKKDEHMHCLTKVADLEDCLHKENFREYSKAIALLGPDFNNHLLPSLVCPKLQLLFACDTWWNRSRSLETIPDDFFKEAQELKALSFYYDSLQSLPQSFCTLRHLRALRLRLGKKADLTLIGELRNLIILDLSSSNFSQLSEHIGKLTKLRSLNLSRCYGLVIQPNVISSLVRLEELYMDHVNIDWEVEGPMGEGRNASLMEFKNLRNLTTLHLDVRDANVLPKDMFSENLQRYRIVIGRINGDREFTGSRLLYLNFRETSQVYQSGIQKLMKNSEAMWLEGFHGVDNIVYVLDGFPQLKEFHLRSNDEVRYIVHSTEDIQPCSAFPNLETLNLENLRNLEKICYSNVTMESFGKLRRIDVRSCNKLKNLFSFSIARKFEVIRVSHCRMMEMLVYHGSEDAPHGNINNEAISEKIEFPQLHSLNLNSLSNLIFFWSGLETTCGSSLSDSPQPLFGEKVVFPSLKDLQLSGMNFIELWSTISCMQNLRKLSVSDCPNLKYLFTVAMAGRLAQLERVQISRCHVMEEVVVMKETIEEGTPQNISFPKLKYLELEDLPNLKRFCTGGCIECPSFLEPRIKNCGELRMFISSNEEEVEGPFFNEKVCFPILEKLTLKGVNLKILWAGQLSITSFGMRNLKSLDIHSCDNLSHLFSLDMARSFLSLEELLLWSCKDMEEVLVTKGPIEEGTPQKISFPKLKNFRLKDLPNLKRFCTGDCIECPSLLELRIENCGVLRMFISSNEEEIEGPFFNEKISFPKLKNLLLRNHQNIKQFCAGCCIEFPSLTYMKIRKSCNEDIHHRFLQWSIWRIDGIRSQTTSLQWKVVLECSSMINWLASSTAKTLVHLRLMSIIECKQMTKIITNEIGDDEIIFDKLKILELSDLPSLRSFYSAGNSVMRFPNLEKLVVSQCPEMRRFSFGMIDAPKLDSILEIKKSKICRCQNPNESYGRVTLTRR
ncbi:hypothetical protein UlMin_033556 [Ulmus minor]